MGKNALGSTVLLAVVVLFSAARGDTQNQSFSVDYVKGTFMKNGEPFNYISGSIHYFRVHPDLWYDRLYKMKYAGLDAVEVYIAWNFHEAEQGKYDFSGSRDLEKFIQTAHDLGLLVILRPGPYICAEWEFGGFPYWLVKKNETLALRTADKVYMQYVTEWFKVLLPKMKKWLYANGGPIISVQVENEYGDDKACDIEYLRQLLNLNKQLLGDNVVYFTLNGHNMNALKCGTVDGTLTTIDFGVGDFEHNFKLLNEFNSSFVGPYVNTEYYIGWLDIWGKKHANVKAEPAAAALEKALAMKANVNMYMFYGGTNFGFMSGAPGDSPYRPVPTSYDYDAAISEAGDMTDKYNVLRKAIGMHKKLPKMDPPKNSTKAAYGRITMKLVSVLHYCTEALTKVKNTGWYNSTYPVRAEVMDMPYGYVLYKHQLEKDYRQANLTVTGIRDRGYVLVNSESLGILYRDGPTSITIEGRKGDTLYILVENMGRVNYGTGLYRPAKGIISNVTIGDQEILMGWQAASVAHDITDLVYCREQRLKEKLGSYMAPSVFMGILKVDKPADTFLRLDAWFKGHVLVNSFNIGRYWTYKGPQKTLYIPAPLLHSGDNIITMTELEAHTCPDSENCYVEFVDTPEVNGDVDGVVSTTTRGYGSHRLV